MRMTPNTIKMEIEAYWKRQKSALEIVEYQSWLNGLYVMNAVGACFNKKNKYPDNPMKKQQVIEEDIQLTEEQKDYYCDQFVKRLQRMERRFNKSKEKINKEITNTGG